MKTIQPIYRILNRYAQEQKAIAARDSMAYEEKSLELERQVKVEFAALRQLVPELAQYDFDSAMSQQEADTIVERIRANARQRTALELLPTGDYFKDNVQNHIIYTPKFVSWQQGGAGHNLLLNFSSRDKDRADRLMNNLVFNMLISLPAKALHLTFVDLSLAGGYEAFTRTLDDSVCGQAILDSREFGDLLSSLVNRMRDTFQNASKKASEVVVLVNYPNNYNSYQDSLYSLFENGYKGGIYFVVMNNTDIQVNDHYKSLYDMHDCFQEIDIPNTDGERGFISPTLIFSHPILRQRLMEVIKEEVEKEATRTISHPYADMAQQSYEPMEKPICFPVGETDSGEKVMFQINTQDNIHSFVIGQTGTGKTVFMHDVITGAIAKYSPEDLQIYLMDLKMGGVEFNRYKGVKHVKALLVDNSDIQITLEILRDIFEEMKRRGDKFRDSGVQDIVNYNKKNPSAKLPQILLIVDECHVLFLSKPPQNERSMYEEVINIFTKIAKEGRNQGVHFMLATQTLLGADIPKDIQYQITDHFLLNCGMKDSEDMVPGSSNITSELTKGQVYYSGRNNKTLFKAYYVPNEEGNMEGDRLVDAVKEKAAPYKASEQFYFTGSQTFSVDDEVKAGLDTISGKYPVAALGRNLNTQLSSLNIPLKKDEAENIMIFGIDDHNQVTETSLAVLNAMIYSTRSRHAQCRYLIMNFLDEEFNDEIQATEDDNVKFVGKREAGETLYRLCEDISSDQAEQTVLFILGQEKFRALRYNDPIEMDDADTEPVRPAAKEKEDYDSFGFNGVFSDSPEDKVEEVGDLLFGDTFGRAPAREKKGRAKNDRDKYKDFQSALRYIVSNGGDQGVHVVMQINKPENYLYDERIDYKTVRRSFKHFVMFRSDESAGNFLRLGSGMALNELSSDLQRLRAIYFNEQNDTYVLFTPYRINH